MIAGLACQVFSLTIFIMLCLEFAWRVKRAGASSAGVLKMMHCSRFLFHAFILGKAHLHPPNGSCWDFREADESMNCSNDERHRNHLHTFLFPGRGTPGRIQRQTCE